MHGSCWFATVSETRAPSYASFPREGTRSMKRGITRVNDMKAECDLSTMKSRRNPYASRLEKSVTMRLSGDVVVLCRSHGFDASSPYPPASSPSICPGHNHSGSGW